MNSHDTARVELDLEGHAIEAAMDQDRLRHLGVRGGDWYGIRLARPKLFGADGTAIQE